MKHIKIFEDFETDDQKIMPVKSKSQIKRELWRANHPEPKGKIITPEELDNFDIPDKIKEMMKEWSVIYKSPFSNSFYSDTNISYTFKPDKSFRVSDHWNFKTSHDSSLHCRTKTPVINNSYISLGQLDNKSRQYEILASLPSNTFIKKQEIGKKKIEYMRDPEILLQKKEFKNRIKNKEIYCEVIEKDGVYKGIVRKYTGYELQIEDDQHSCIYSKNSSSKGIPTWRTVKLFDKDGNSIKDPFDVKFESMRHLIKYINFK